LIIKGGEPFCLAGAGEEEDPGRLSLILIGGWFFARSASFALRSQVVQMKWKSSRSASAWLTPTHLLCCQMLHLSHAILCVPSSICP
jgi:hypothetical protein